MTDDMRSGLRPLNSETSILFPLFYFLFPIPHQDPALRGKPGLRYRLNLGSINTKSSIWDNGSRFGFLLFPDQPFDLAQALGHRNSFGAHIRAPPHGFASPYPVIGIDLCQSASRGRIPGIENVAKRPQQGRRAQIIRIGPADGTGCGA